LARALRFSYSLSSSARRSSISARIFERDFANPKKSSARKKKPRLVRRLQTILSCRAKARCGANVASRSVLSLPTAGNLAAIAIPSSSVDFPDPFSPTRKVTDSPSSRVSKLRITGTLNGK